MPLMIIKDIVCGQESHEESISVGLIGWKPVQKIQFSISNQEYGRTGEQNMVLSSFFVMNPLRIRCESDDIWALCSFCIN